MKHTGRDLHHHSKAINHSTPMRMMIISYELGDLHRALFRYTFLTERLGDPRGYKGEAKLAIADILTQLRILLFELGLDWDEVVELGEDHLIETWEAIQSGEREA